MLEPEHEAYPIITLLLDDRLSQGNEVDLLRIFGMERPMTRRLLPIGLQDFRTMREQGYYYVDKTSLIRQMVEEGRFRFLSRPRRFGKSLLLDTLRSLFDCREELFRGLDIHGHWDWSETIAVTPHRTKGLTDAQFAPGVKTLGPPISFSGWWSDWLFDPNKLARTARNAVTPF